MGVATELNFGRVVSASSSATDYTVSAQNNNLSPATPGFSNTTVSRGKINISCNTGTCYRKTVKVLLSAPGSSQNGRLGRLKAFNAVSVDSTMGISTRTLADGSLEITIASFPNTTASLYFGGTAAIDANSSANGTGNYTTPYTVSVTGTGATSTYSSNAKAQVLRGISVSKTGDLLFGTIVRPSGGTGHVSMPLTSVFPNATLGASWIGTSTTNRPRFTITAETGTAFSIQIATRDTSATNPIQPPNGYFDLVGPGGAKIRVTTTSDAVASKTIGSFVGFAGTYSFNVGGEFDLPSTTPSGTYTAVFNVVVSYQ